METVSSSYNPRNPSHPAKCLFTAVPFGCQIVIFYQEKTTRHIKNYKTHHSLKRCIKGLVLAVEVKALVVTLVFHRSPSCPTSDPIPTNTADYGPSTCTKVSDPMALTSPSPGQCGHSGNES